MRKYTHIRLRVSYYTAAAVERPETSALIAVRLQNSISTIKYFIPSSIRMCYSQLSLHPDTPTPQQQPQSIAHTVGEVLANNIWSYSGGDGSGTKFSV